MKPVPAPASTTSTASTINSARLRWRARFGGFSCRRLSSSRCAFASCSSAGGGKPGPPSLSGMGRLRFTAFRFFAAELFLELVLARRGSAQSCVCHPPHEQRNDRRNHLSAYHLAP